MRLNRRTTTTTTAAAALIAVLIAAVLVFHALTTGPAAPAQAHPSATASTRPAVPYQAATAVKIAHLPEARYNAVIPGLLPYRSTTIPADADTVYRISQDAALYGANQATPIARLAAKNFLNQDTVIVVVQHSGPWARILTPARRSLPSVDPTAPAQTAAWIRSDLLTEVQATTTRILVSVSAQTIALVTAKGQVVHTFPAAVGANGTPTPTGVTGYLQARYLDPKQDETIYPIGLTSLHSAAADEPYTGTDGGLIGVHYQPDNTGAISHGCIRLNQTAITAIDQLPLGTLITIQK